MATSAVSRRAPAPLLDPSHQRGLTSLLSQTYGKPVHLNLIKLKQPHQDPDILAQFVAQKLRDRKNAPRRVIRDAAWKAELPSALAITKRQQERNARDVSLAANPLTLESLKIGEVEKVSDVLKGLNLSQVSSVRVEAGGRLSKRITANRAQGKIAIRGATRKGASHMLRGAVPDNVASAGRSGKRRIGSYGVKVSLGYS